MVIIVTDTCMEANKNTMILVTRCNFGKLEVFLCMALNSYRRRQVGGFDYFLLGCLYCAVSK